MSNDDTRPSATVDEAIDRYTATANARIAQLTAQRDAVAQMLRDILKGFDNGEFVCNTEGNGPRRIAIARSFIVAADQRTKKV